MTRALAAHEQKLKRGDSLPHSLAPRGLSREQAAAYVGISASLFDRAIDDGIMPRAKRIYGRTVWDRRQLDVAMDKIDDDEAGQNPFD